MEIDRILRRCRLALDQNALPLRDRTDLHSLEAAEVAGERVLLDTCVIVDQLRGRLPADVEGPDLGKNDRSLADRDGRVELPDREP